MRVPNVFRKGREDEKKKLKVVELKRESLLIMFLLRVGSLRFVFHSSDQVFNQHQLQFARKRMMVMSDRKRERGNESSEKTNLGP